MFFKFINNFEYILIYLYSKYFIVNNLYIN